MGWDGMGWSCDRGAAGGVDDWGVVFRLVMRLNVYFIQCAVVQRADMRVEFNESFGNSVAAIL